MATLKNVNTQQSGNDTIYKGDNPFSASLIPWKIVRQREMKRLHTAESPLIPCFSF